MNLALADTGVNEPLRSPRGCTLLLKAAATDVEAVRRGSVPRMATGD